MKIMAGMLIGVTFLLGNLQTSEAADLYDVIYRNVYFGNGNERESQWITDAIFYASAQYQVDPILVTAIMETESSFRFNAYSKAGAVGLMQLMPDTAKMLGVNPHNVLENVLGGVNFLASLIKRFSDWGEYGVTYAVAAYNAGPGAVEKCGGVPNYSETQNYVLKVANIYNRILRMANS